MTTNSGNTTTNSRDTTTNSRDTTTNSRDITANSRDTTTNSRDEIAAIVALEPSSLHTPAIPEAIRNIFPKADGAAHVERTLTGTHYVLYNALYAYAYDTLLDAETHTVSTSAIFKSTRNMIDSESELTEHLNALLTTQHRWNIFDKDKRTEWGATTLISSYTINIERNEVTYTFSPHLRRLLRGEPYTTMHILPQSPMYSKYSHALSELLRTYFRAKHNAGETPWISIKSFRAFMGIQEHEYQRFNNFKPRVITQPLDSIRDELPFTVEVRYQRNGNSVSAIKFMMKQKKTASVPPKSLYSRAQLQLGYGVEANGATTFEMIPVGTRYKLVGGTGVVCIKTGANTAIILRENGRKDEITMVNVHVGVTML
jgi:hypothetical protein